MMTPPYRCTFLSLFLVRQSRLFEECAGRTRGFIHSAKVIIKINAEPIGSQLAIFVQTALRGRMKRREFISLFGGAVVALKT
jgi:hypothetical protein